MAPNVCRMTHEDFFGQKFVFMIFDGRKYPHIKLSKFGKIVEKYLWHPQKFACSCTYDWSMCHVIRSVIYEIVTLTLICMSSHIYPKAWGFPDLQRVEQPAVSQPWHSGVPPASLSTGSGKSRDQNVRGSCRQSCRALGRRVQFHWTIHRWFAGMSRQAWKFLVPGLPDCCWTCGFFAPVETDNRNRPALCLKQHTEKSG